MRHEEGSAKRGRAGELVVSARLFSDATPGIGIDGSLSIGASRVTFQAGDAVTELPVAGLESRLSGFNDRVLFLAHPNHPGTEIATSNPAALSAPSIAALPSLSRALAGRRARRRRLWGCAAVAVIAALLAVIALLATVGIGIGRLGEMLSLVW
jgi:hypothetical protein